MNPEVRKVVEDWAASDSVLKKSISRLERENIDLKVAIAIYCRENPPKELQFEDNGVYVVTREWENDEEAVKWFIDEMFKKEGIYDEED